MGIGMDEEPSGIILEGDLPLTRLAGWLRLAETQVLRRVLELVEDVRRSPPEGGRPRVIHE